MPSVDLFTSVDIPGKGCGVLASRDIQVNRGSRVILIFGFSIVVGYLASGHIDAVCVSGFSTILDFIMGGCQSAQCDYLDFWVYCYRSSNWSVRCSNFLKYVLAF